MATTNPYKEVCKKDFDPAKVATMAAQNPECLSHAIAGLGEAKATIKYGCDKVLRYLAAHSPEVLYPYFEHFAANLDSEKTILRWGAIEIISHLARVDSGNKFEPMLAEYFSPISGPVMITASNLIKASARIALARPELADQISKRLLQVEKGRYQTEECRQIAMGQAVRSFDQFFDQVQDKAAVTRFVKLCLKSRRNSTRQAAEKFLHKWKLD